MTGPRSLGRHRFKPPTVLSRDRRRRLKPNAES
jgi:hypothetical protein